MAHSPTSGHATQLDFQLLRETEFPMMTNEPSFSSWRLRRVSRCDDLAGFLVIASEAWQSSSSARKNIDVKLTTASGLPRFARNDAL